jgi:glutamate-1-semialdehyde aminotransferase
MKKWYQHHTTKRLTQHQQAEDNMREFNFNDPEDFKGVFASNNREITNAIVDSIQEAHNFQKTSADMFSITFGEEDLAYEISLPKDQWEKALEKCLENYHKWDCGDEAIDTYLILKQIREWDSTK